MTPDLLFDTSPDDSAPEDTKKKKPRKRAVAAAVVVVAEAEPQCGSEWQSLGPPLGKLDGHYQCLDESCGADALDIIDEDGRMWLLECCFCGTRFWGRVVAGVLDKSDDKAFRLRGGRFNGLTFDEVIREPRGDEYISWAAAEHPKSVVKEAAKTWLAESGHAR
jgi:hypothetical protein